jgi:hypothetical protein
VRVTPATGVVADVITGFNLSAGDGVHGVDVSPDGMQAFVTDGTAGKIYTFTRVTDCNTNGIHDICDVDCGPPGGYCDVPGCGQRGDCDSNGIPDECQPADDCNTNAIQNICDLAAGTSQDCNTNGVPDECDITEGTRQDCQPDQVPDECELGGVVYVADFESGAGPEWSSATVDSSVPDPFTTFSGRFSNDLQTLTLDVASGVDYVLTFDLCIIDSWDGCSTSWGPDYFNVFIDDAEVYHECFEKSGPSGAQSYPDWPSVGPGQFGWGSWFDSIYRRVMLTFTAGDSSVQITFQGEGLQGVSDESWGIDNVSIAIVVALAVAQVIILIPGGRLGGGIPILSFGHARIVSCWPGVTRPELRGYWGSRAPAKP